MCAPGTVETVRARADAEGIRLDRRTALMAGAGAALSAALPGRAVAARTPSNRLVDLTHVYSEEFLLFLGAPVETTREVIVTVVPDGFTRSGGRSGNTPVPTWTRPRTSSPTGDSRRRSRPRSWSSPSSSSTSRRACGTTRTRS